MNTSRKWAKAIQIGLILYILTLILTASVRLTCLPDSPDRFYMGRGTANQCLYQDMNTGEIYESPLQIGAGLSK